MQLITMKLKDIRPYPNNPRKNDTAVEAVAESIRQCGYVAPIIVDENGVILAGHTRYKALKALGRSEAEAVVKEGLTEEQKKKYRTKVSEFLPSCGISDILNSVYVSRSMKSVHIRFSCSARTSCPGILS